MSTLPNNYEQVTDGVIAAINYATTTIMSEPLSTKNLARAIDMFDGVQTGVDMLVYFLEEAYDDCKEQETHGKRQLN